MQHVPAPVQHQTPAASAILPQQQTWHTTTGQADVQQIRTRLTEEIIRVFSRKKWVALWGMGYLCAWPLHVWHTAFKHSLRSSAFIHALCLVLLQLIRAPAQAHSICARTRTNAQGHGRLEPQNP